MRITRWVPQAIMATVLLAGTAMAEPDPKPVVVDLKPVKDKAMVFQDAKGGTYVVIRDGGDRRVFFGTAGKTLYQQRTTGGSSNGKRWSISIWAPRIREMRPGEIVHNEDDTFTKTCDGEDDLALTQLTGDKAKAVLDKSTFNSPALVRMPYLLARDDSGVYYYVDAVPEPSKGNNYVTKYRNHRVWVGKKGAMKQLPLTDVVTDAAGDVFSTKTGDLRLVRGKDSYDKSTTTWVKGGKKTELAWLDRDVNSVVIFSELGIYTFLGTICDNVKP